MNCFPCFSSQKSKKLDSEEEEEQLPVAHATSVAHATGPDDSSSPTVNGKQKSSVEARNEKDELANNTTEDNVVKAFTFRDLAAATKNFRQECLLGEGGFGRVYKGTIQSSGQVVAVKQLDRNGMQGNKEFLVEVSDLSLLHHPNLVNLVGYCADGDQRLLVYEYMPMGSIEDYLFEISEDKKPLDWIARMKIASGAAQGLEYLHEKAYPPIIFRDLKSSNIMLDEEFNPRLSDYGLAKLGLGGGKTHISPRVMGTYGYCAPEYERNGELTLKSDVYSFGVVLLELITGRRAVDTTRQTDEQNLVSWAQPFFKDPKRFPEMADPLLQSKFPVRSLNQAIGVAAMCLQEEPSVRPLISDAVAALSFLTVAQDEVLIPSPPHPVPENDQNGDNVSHHDGDHTDHEDGDSSESSSDSEEEEEEEEEEDSVDHQEQEGNSEKNQGQVKKRVKWATNSRCKSNVKSEDGSIGSTSSHNINIESHDESCGQNLKSNGNGNGSGSGSAKWGSSSMQSEDGSVGSNSSHNSDNDDEFHDGSVSSSSSSRNSDVESQQGILNGQNSRSTSNSNMGGSKHGGFGSNSRQDSSAGGGSRHGSDAFDLRSNNSINVESRDGSVGSHSSDDWNSSRRSSNVTSHNSSVGFSSSFNSNAGSSDDDDDDDGSNLTRNSNV